MDGPAILTMREAADLLRVGQSTLYRLVAQGVVRVIRIPGSSVTRIRRAALDQLIGQWEQGGRRRDGGR